MATAAVATAGWLLPARWACVTALALIVLWFARGRSEEGAAGVPIGALAYRVMTDLDDRRQARPAQDAGITIELRDAVWREPDGRVFARAQSLRGRLDLNALAAGNIILRDVEVTRAVVNLRESAGEWNYQDVLAELLADRSGRAASGGRDRLAMLERVLIRDGIVHVEAADRQFSLEDLDARLTRVTFTGPTLPEPLIELETGTAILDEPAEERRLAVRADGGTARLRGDTVTFETDRFGVEGARFSDVRGIWSRSIPVYGVEARGRAVSIGLADLRQFLPDRAPDTGSARFDWSIERSTGEAVRVRLTELFFESLGSTVTGSLALRVETDHADLRDADLRLMPVSATLVEAFAGSLPLDAAVRGTVRGTDGRLGLDLTAMVAAKGVEVSPDSGAAVLAITGMVDLTGPAAAYDLAGRLRVNDVRHALDRAVPPVGVDARFTVEGRGANPDEADARIRLDGGFSGGPARPGDTIALAARVRAGALTLDTLAARLATLRASAAGDWRFIEPASGTLRYAATVDSLRPWGEYLPVVGDTSVAGSLELAGTVSGTLNRPRIEGELDAEGIRIAGWGLAMADARWAVTLGGEVPEGVVSLSAHELTTPAAGAYTSATAQLSLGRPEFTLNVDAARSDGGAVVIAATGRAPRAGPGELVVGRADVDLVNRRWTLVEPATFRFGSGQGLAVEAFEMAEASGAGRIRVDGRVLPLAQASLDLRTAALPVGEVQELLGRRRLASGLLWTTARFEGPAASPRITAEFRIENGEFESVTFATMEGSLNYAAGRLQTRAAVGMYNEGALEFDFDAPVAINLDATRKISLVDSGVVAGSLTARAVPITPLQSLSRSVENLTGRIDGRVELRGSVAEPEFDGRMVLSDGSVRVIPLDQVFTEIAGELVVDGRRMTLTELRARSDGTATAAGTVTFADLRSPVAALAIRFDRFRPAAVPGLEDAAVFGDLTLEGPHDALVLGGSLRVADGYVPVPEFRSRSDDIFSDLPDFSTGGTISDREENRILAGLVIRDLRVQVDPDVWFIAEAARAQLSGSLRLDRAGDTFMILGTLAGERGTYTLQAGPIIRRFEILSAEVRFLGTSEPNPALDILARRVVYSADRPFEVEVRIGGTLRAPTLNLASADAPNFPQSELLSLLFFGRQTLELGGGGIPGEAVLEGTFVRGLAELASLQLEETLVRELGISVDLFQVRFGPGGIGGFGAPTFVLGWEIGRDFFLTAESAIAGLFSDETGAGNWALRLDWAFDRRSRVRASYELVTPSALRRGLGLPLPITRPRQFSLELRRRWSY